MSGGKGGSTPSGNTTTTTTSQPWSVQQPYLTDIFAQAQNLYQNFTPQYFPGQTYSPENNAQANALQSIVGTQPGADLTAATGANLSNNVLSGGIFNQDPSMFGLGMIGAGATPAGQTLQNYASGMYSAAGNPYTQGLTDSIMASTIPSIQKQFINGGGLSSPDAAYATSQGANAAVAPVLANLFQQEQQNQLGAAAGLGQLQTTALTNLGNQYGSDVGKQMQGLALLPGTISSLYSPAQATLSAGGAQQTFDQAAINDAIQRFNYSQTLPYQQLNEYLGQVAGNYGGTGTTTSPYFTNPVANALGMGLGGLQLLGGLGGLGGGKAAGSAGTAAGLIGAGLI